MIRTAVAGSATLACAAAITAAAYAPKAVNRAEATGRVRSPSHASASGQSPAAEPVRICRSSDGREGRAAKLSAAILQALRGRASVVGVRVNAPRLGINCYLNAGLHFDSASTVKATILAALLRKAQEEHRGLTGAEQRETWSMITQSSNSAATALWNDVGMASLQHFLNLAKMRHTLLGQNGYWGLTQETAHDEMLLMRLLAYHNKVLANSSRRYELTLMADVTASQRWGVPAGVPAGFTVHVKNGWLPVSGGWVINSVGAFTRPGRTYSIVVLTDGNPSMGYGIATIENVAIATHRILNPGDNSVAPRSVAGPTWGIPDEYIPPGVTGRG